MEPFKIRTNKKDGPEAKIQEGIIKKLRSWEWLVIPTHGNAYQMGFPDLYCAHYTHGARWIEVKNPGGYSFTTAQIKVFPELHAKNIGIWILFSDDDSELMKIFKPANWFEHFYHKVLR